MKHLTVLSFLMVTLALMPNATPGNAAAETAPPRIKAYYTRLPYDDHGMTGK